MKKTLHLILSLFIFNIIQAQPCPSITSFSVTPPSCFGLSNGAIEINYTAGTPPYTVTWSSPLPPSTSAALSQSVSGVPSGAYSATVTDNNGCITSLPVNVNQPSLLILMVSANQTICYGQSAQIYAAGQGGTPPYTYSWTPTFIGGGPHTVNPTTTASYYVSASDANGCVSSTYSITVNVTPSLAIVGNTVTICDGDAVTLTPNIVGVGNGGPYSYLWNPTGANTSSISVIGNAPSGTTATTFTVYINDGCTIPSAATLFNVTANICTGIQELSDVNLVTIYPNPANNLLMLSSIEEIQKIEVANITSQILLSETVKNKTHQLQLQNFPKGIYFVNLSYANGSSVTKKFLKQ